MAPQQENLFEFDSGNQNEFIKGRALSHVDSGWTPVGDSRLDRSMRWPSMEYLRSSCRLCHSPDRDKGMAYNYTSFHFFSSLELFSFSVILPILNFPFYLHSAPLASIGRLGCPFILVSTLSPLPLFHHWWLTVTAILHVQIVTVQCVYIGLYYRYYP